MSGITGGAAHWLLVVALIAPLLPLLLLGIARTRALALAWAPWAALPALAAALILPAGTQLEVGWMLLGSRFGIDDLTRVFLFFTALLWWLAGLYANVWLAAAGRRRFAAFFLASMTGNLGLVLAQDLLSFYLLFALMSFASYGLVSNRARSACGCPGWR